MRQQGMVGRLAELRRIQQEQDMVLFPIEQSITLTALTHCLKEGHKHTVVRERVPIALAMAKACWRQASPARHVEDYNIVLSSALNLLPPASIVKLRLHGDQSYGVRQRFRRIT